MMDDTITTLLRGVADGSIAVADARTALEGAELTEDEMASAIDHGVFNIAEPGTIVSASLAPSGASYLTMFFLAWGLFWICYWSFSMIYGLAKGWDQQQLSFHLAMNSVSFSEQPAVSARRHLTSSVSDTNVLSPSKSRPPE